MEEVTLKLDYVEGISDNEAFADRAGPSAASGDRHGE
jgi:hypothetical protein